MQNILIDGFISLYQTLEIADLKFAYHSFKNEDGTHFGYQRSDAQARAKRIAEDWNPKLLDAPVVSKRNNGGLYVIDGQARVVALKSLGEKSVVCRVLEGLTLEEEVNIFIDLQDKRKNISATQKYAALASVEGSWADRADKILRDYKLWTGIKKHAPEGFITISVGGVLNKLHKDIGSESFVTILSRSLGLLKEAYPQEQPFSSATIEAMAKVVNEMDEEVWEKKGFPFLKVLQVGDYDQNHKLNTFEKVERLANEMSNGSSGAKASKYQQLFQKALNKV